MAESFFYEKKTEAAFLIYDEVLIKYNNVFARDVYRAAQFAYSAGDIKSCIKYLGACYSIGLQFNQTFYAPVLKTKF